MQNILSHIGICCVPVERTLTDNKTSLQRDKRVEILPRIVIEIHIELNILECLKSVAHVKG